MRLSPILTDLGTYPFTRLDEAKKQLAAAGVEFVDFGVGDPREPTEPFIREALVAAVGAASSYPLAVGLPELRAAICTWVRRRFAVELDPGRHVIPTLGSKEAIFSLAQAVIDCDGGKRLVLVTEPGYPVQERGALFAGAEVERLPLLERNGFLPDLDAVNEETWRRAAIVWVNYPNNPTGAVAPIAFYERLAALARRHDFLLASDEAYTELFFGEPPVSALQLPDLTNVAVFNTLSKRSSMTGYRSGFVAGDPAVIAALKLFRPSVGTAPQEFVQRAAIAAWSDETHVERTRASYAAKRELLLDVLERKHIRVAGSEATMYLWLEVPGDRDDEALATRLLEHGLVVSPGSFFGATGAGYWRIALVPTLDECRRAAEILEEAL
ncbi:MAG: pyridoxal phosphate-dependent aminotransferase [Gaiellaceae bacterium]